MNNNGIEPHATWQIFDSSKVNAYMQCPRRFFYRYILGWEPGKNIHFIFGEAYHRGMKIMLDEHLSTESIIKAYDAFCSYYREFYDPMDDDQNGVKTPAKALQAFTQYSLRYGVTDRFEVLHSEIAGVVPISDTDVMHFRMDGVVRDANLGNKIVLLEHKTGTMQTAAWSAQWILGTQPNIYLHALYCIFGPEDVWGAMINGTFLYKDRVEFLRVPIRRHPTMLQAQLWSILDYLESIKEDMSALMEDCTAEQNSLECFPMNTQSCTMYSVCPYHDLCCVWANPLQHLDQMPGSFNVAWWNPSDYDPNVKVIDLTSAVHISPQPPPQIKEKEDADISRNVPHQEGQ